MNAWADVSRITPSPPPLPLVSLQSITLFSRLRLTPPESFALQQEGKKTHQNRKQLISGDRVHSGPGYLGRHGHFHPPTSLETMEAPPAAPPAEASLFHFSGLRGVLAAALPEVRHHGERRRPATTGN